MRIKIAFVQSTVLAVLAIFPFQLQAGDATEIRDHYANKRFLECYQSALKEAASHPKSAVPVFYAAVALTHYEADAKLQERVKHPWGKMITLCENAKLRDGTGKQLARYQKGLFLIQKRLYTKLSTSLKFGDPVLQKQFDRMAIVFDSREGTWKSIYHFGLDAFDKDYDFQEWDHPIYRLANTGRDDPSLTKDQKELILLHNLARMNPQLFEQTFVQRYLDQHFNSRGDRNDPYVRSLIRDLKAAKPASPVFSDPSLMKASNYHAKDLSSNDVFMHASSDGTSFGDRLDRFTGNHGMIGENCQAGLKKPLDCFMSLMIDQGVESLGHRKNILNPYYSNIGIGIVDPDDKWKIWVFDFASF